MVLRHRVHDVRNVIATAPPRAFAWSLELVAVESACGQSLKYTTTRTSSCLAHFPQSASRRPLTMLDRLANQEGNGETSDRPKVVFEILFLGINSG